MATIDNLQVLFGQGTSTAFETELKEPNKLYFLTDTKEVFLGNVRYAFGNDISVNITGSGDTVSNVTWNPSTKTLTIVLGTASDALSIQNALTTALSSCVKHISSDRGSSILVDDSNKDDVTIGLNIATGTYAGNVVLEECSDGLRANVVITDTGIVDVTPGDKVLKMTGDTVGAVLSITTEAENGKQYVILKGIDGVEISRFDASDFVKSGMLKSVTIEEAVVSGQIHKILVMEFYVEGGQTQTVRVDLQEFVDVYTAKPGGGLTLDSDSAFSISNSVSASSGVNTNQTVNFNSTLTLKTIMYDAHGLITGVKDITFSIPGTSGSAGTQNAKNTLLTYVSMNDHGQISGEYVSLVNAIGVGSTDLQVPTAKAVYDAIDAATTKWVRF